MHPSQHVLLSGLRAPWIVDGVEGGRGLWKPGKHRAFGNRQVLERLAEIDLRRGGKAGGALAKEDLVDVELEDLVLAKAGFDLPGEECLPQLARNRLLARQEKIPGDLHRDRSGALLGARGQVRERGTGDAQIVNSAVLVETFVLGGQNSLFHDIRDLADPDDGTPLLAELAQQLALRGDDPKGDFRLLIRQARER